MLHFSRWQIVIIAVVSLAAVLLSLPNVFSAGQLSALPGWATQRMPLGLDLQGGSHLLLRMNIGELTKDRLESIAGDVRETLRRERIGYQGLSVGADQVRVTIRDASDLAKARDKLSAIAQPTGGSAISGVARSDVSLSPAEGNAFVLRPTEDGAREAVTRAMGAAIETIRRRVDALGTTEPTIQRQGFDRILVQVPGFNNPQQLKDLIGKTAKLTFQLVDTTVPATEAAQGRTPPGSTLFDSEEEAGGKILLQNRVIVSGENLVDAQPGFDQRTNEPVITFRFDSAGALRFGQTTQANVGKPFAILLDSKVISAPVIREPILGGTGQISGNFAVDEANRLAIQLRSGALPASLDIVEERTVGPSLGADSIEAGKVSMLIGFLGVTLFLVAGYGLFGLFAILALVVNLLLITAAMSVMQSTLTLPGIAGIVLTMGMSVDANVLINERIREEARAGRTAMQAINTAFEKAIGTITDTNLTGLLAAAIMFWFGSGAVRGFAVTLAIGIIASFFTATTITRFLVAQWVRVTRPKTVPI